MSLIARLIEAGTPPDLIEEVAMLLAEQKVLEKRRSADRQRQQDKRDRDASHVTSRDVTVCHTAPPSPSPKENNSNPHPRTPGTQTHGRARGDDFPRPDFCQSEQTWRDFKANRRAKRLPCTPSAHAKLIRDIHAMADEDWPPGRLFDEIVARGWAAAHDPRTDRTPPNDRYSKPTGTATAAQRAIATLGG